MMLDDKSVNHITIFTYLSFTSLPVTSIYLTYIKKLALINAIGQLEAMLI